MTERADRSAASGPLDLALWGAQGRMGRAIDDLVAQGLAGDDLRIVARPEETVGDLVGALRGARAVLDFTRPDGTARLAPAAAEAGVALVVGTTALDEAAQAALGRAAHQVPVVVAPNTSQGVAVLSFLARLAAELLGDGFDAEVVEMHHRGKADAPSGTALRLAELLAKAKGLDPERAPRCGRDGRDAARAADEIGVMALRGGSVVGEHTVVLAGLGERLELTHRAGDRSLFARGALRAARWVVDQPPGLYGMEDVLGLEAALASRG